MKIKKQVKRSFFLFLVLWAPPALTLTFSEDFTTSSYAGSGEVVWNTELGILHPPLEVYHYLDGIQQSKTFLLGDGRDGAFIPSRYATFSQGGDLSGQIIRLNTDTFDNLQLTRFQLDPGWTLQPVGSKPLMIRVLGQITIGGNIDCSGESGEDLNGDPATPTTGGSGRCGGGDGGDGGTASTNGGAGSLGGPQIPNGVSPGVDGPTPGGGSSVSGTGGGGGGTYVPSRGAGYDPLAGAGGGGIAGLLAADNDFDYEGGGSGGGGGAFYGAGLAAQNSAGGGGGGGGGLIWMMAGGDIVLSGDVLANGGDGGTGGGSQLAGGGGGGAGGSIALFAGGDVYLTGGAVVSADRGRGRGPAGHLGGDGAVGRTWLVGRSGYAIGGPPFEFPVASVTDVGVVALQTGAFTLSSGEIDLQNTSPTLTQLSDVSTFAGLGALDVNVATGAESGFTPTWQGTTTLPLKLERYLRFQIILTNTVSDMTTQVNSITLVMDEHQSNQFNFVAACGGLSGATSQIWFWILIFLIPFFMHRLLRRRALRLA